MTIIFFNKNGQYDVGLVRLAGYLWPYTDLTMQRHTASGDDLRTDKQDF